MGGVVGGVVGRVEGGVEGGVVDGGVVGGVVVAYSSLFAPLLIYEFLFTLTNIRPNLGLFCLKSFNLLIRYFLCLRRLVGLYEYSAYKKSKRQCFKFLTISSLGKFGCMYICVL